MPDIWTFHSAGQIVFGCGASARIGELAARLKLKRVFLITDDRLASSGIGEKVTRPLRDAGIECAMFTGGMPEPSIALAEQCIAEAKDAQPDGIVGLGGGSNMDLAKITAAVLAHGGDPRDYVGEDRVPGPVMPLLCVPTTAGTGSEVSGSAILTDEANELKVGILSNFLRPRIAMVDPELTLSCPRKVTADSGIDALTHAIEAYTAVENSDYPLPPGERSVYQGRNAMGDAVSAKAIFVIGANLVRAVEQPNDLAAREAMSLGAMLGGLAFSNVGVALVHALEYPVGGALHCSHGAGNGLLLPYVMEFNLPAREARFARIAELLGDDVRGLSTSDAAHHAVAAVRRLNAAIGIPERLRDLGARSEQLPQFAEKAFGIKRMLRVNPRTVTQQEMLGILEAAY